MEATHPVLRQCVQPPSEVDWEAMGERELVQAAADGIREAQAELERRELLG